MLTYECKVCGNREELEFDLVDIHGYSVRSDQVKGAGGFFLVCEKCGHSEAILTESAGSVVGEAYNTWCRALLRIAEQNRVRLIDCGVTASEAFAAYAVGDSPEMFFRRLMQTAKQKNKTGQKKS